MSDTKANNDLSVDELWAALHINALALAKATSPDAMIGNRMPAPESAYVQAKRIGAFAQALIDLKKPKPSEPAEAA